MTIDDLPKDFKEGSILLVDKPKNWTSFDVVNKLRYALRKHLGSDIKVGHAGTLDPLATGLLLICTGKFTKRLQEFQGLDKAYTGQICLGASTPSYDLETEPDVFIPYDPNLSLEDLRLKAKEFEGEITQYPPVFSAIKVDGKPLYKRARQGEAAEVPPRQVHIRHFDLISMHLPHVEFHVVCSKGTYIRSLAHDFGRSLGSAGYLSELRRVSIGEYNLKNAWTMEELIQCIRELPPVKPE